VLLFSAPLSYTSVSLALSCYLPFSAKEHRLLAVITVIEEESKRTRRGQRYRLFTAASRRGSDTRKTADKDKTPQRSFTPTKRRDVKEKTACRSLPRYQPRFVNLTDALSGPTRRETKLHCKIRLGATRRYDFGADSRGGERRRRRWRHR
jgi:hypothetical protein